MNNKKEYLSEEDYQKTKRKITKVSLIILIIGLLIGIGLILVGVVLHSNANKTNEERYNESYKVSQEKMDTDNVRLKEIETEKYELNNQIQTKQYSCDSLDMRDSNWYAESTKCEREVSALKLQLSELEMEKFQLENANYTVYYDKVSNVKYIIFYVLGGMIIFVSASIAGNIYFIAKRREITAFTVQQTMPIVQEGIEKTAPTVGDAVGIIGKSLAKGIKEGINEVGNTKDQ